MGWRRGRGQESVPQMGGEEREEFAKAGFVGPFHHDKK